ncbi:hypothetical protein MES5069_550063 [Mesorhizobium escarrei]|uniref:Transposase n=1 Tax=Mesorhizobium escarrei TaxID=666018 RepID=A0ABM9ECC6_9HYPH|nr:hypothetical protein MES5069_550063 [Mesorhizobium escarrei]
MARNIAPDRRRDRYPSSSPVVCFDEIILGRQDGGMCNSDISGRAVGKVGYCCGAQK